MQSGQKWRTNPFMHCRCNSRANEIIQRDSVAALTTISCLTDSACPEAWQYCGRLRRMAKAITRRTLTASDVSHDTRWWRQIRQQQAQQTANYVAHGLLWEHSPIEIQIAAIHFVKTSVCRAGDSLQCHGKYSTLCPHPWLAHTVPQN